MSMSSIYRLTPPRLIEQNAIFEQRRILRPIQRYTVVVPAEDALAMFPGQPDTFRLWLDEDITHSHHAHLWKATLFTVEKYIYAEFHSLYGRNYREVMDEISSRVAQLATARIGATPVLVAGGQ